MIEPQIPNQPEVDRHLPEALGWPGLSWEKPGYLCFGSLVGDTAGSQLPGLAAAQMLDDRDRMEAAKKEKVALFVWGILEASMFLLS